MTTFRRRRLHGLYGLMFSLAGLLLLAAGGRTSVAAETASETAPVTPAAVETAPMSLEIRVLDDGNGVYRFVADNPNPIPFSVRIVFSELTNFDLDTDLPAMTVVPPGARGQVLLAIRKADANQASRYGYRYLYWPGDYTLEPDDYVYLVPYGHGTKHLVGNGYGGETGDGTGNQHFGESRYALDIIMDTGTPVTAARGGIVTAVGEDADAGGLDGQYLGAGNFVRIYHDDGTQALYVHLMLNGAAVETGERVAAGQIIGYSGNTGYSSGPHLHFAVTRIVRRDDGGTTLHTIPTRFVGLDGEPIVLEQGRFYYATHPGKSAFTAFLGETLTNADYEDMIETIPSADSIQLDTEQVDGTYLLFAENATDTPRELTLSLSLDNMTASRPLPHQQTLPARSRVYLLLVRATDPGEAHTFDVVDASVK
jgi:murein DD-endopeptidase MepM/ murein hydrolase activator NlpD